MGTLRFFNLQPLMDGTVRGLFAGLGLNHGPAHLYLALMEASAFGLRWIVELLREHGVPINRLIATGGLPHHNRAFVEVYADVLNVDIEVHPSSQANQDPPQELPLRHNASHIHWGCPYRYAGIRQRDTPL